MQTTTDLLYTSHQWWLRCGAQELTTVVPSYLYSHPVTKQLFLFYTWGKWNTEDLSGTDMTLNLNIFPYTVPVPNSWQTPKQDGVSAPKYSNCDQWTSLLILFPCACFKASWYHRIASGVSVAQLLSCFQWDCLSDARSRESSFNDYRPNAHQQHQHRVSYLWVNCILLSLADLALQSSLDGIWRALGRAGALGRWKDVCWGHYLE